MTIVSRYLIRSYLAMIGSCLSAFLAIYLIIDFLERIGRFSRAGAPLNSIFLYFICKIPEIISQTAPMALLMGTILTVGAFSRNNEINALRSSGLSLWQIGRPLLAAAAACSLTLLAMEELVVPPANAKMLYIQQVVVQKKGIAAFFRQNNIWYRDDKFILQAKLFDPVKQSLQGVTVWEMDHQLKPVSRIDAHGATPAEDGWQLIDANRRVFPGGAPQDSTLKKMFMKIDLKPDDLKVVAKSAEDMGFIALWRYCESLKDGGYDTTGYRTQLHAKISLPFSALVMAFIGIPFSLRSGRSSGAGVGIGISIGRGLVYFISNAFLLSLGQAGAIPPVAAAWAANMIFAATGLWFTLKIDT
jgi:lipopolysaccharide export system permease protein